MSFRVGTKVPRHVYEGDRPLFTAATEEEAARLVGLLSASAPHGITPLERRLRDALRDIVTELAVIQDGRLRNSIDRDDPEYIAAKSVLAEADAKERG